MGVVREWMRRAGVRRRFVAPLRMGCERHALALTRARPEHGRSRILCYHSVGTPQWGVNDVSPKMFRRQIEAALSAGYQFVEAEKLAAGRGGRFQLAITFDDGMQSVGLNAAPILADYGIPWTIFVVSAWADKPDCFGDATMLSWKELERLAAAGATIGSHSVSHPNFACLDPGAICEELTVSRRTIEARLGVAPTAFAIPLGTSKAWHEAAHQSALEAGYQTVYAQSEDHRFPGTIPRTFITRFDGPRLFRAALAGAFDGWEEWV